MTATGVTGRGPAVPGLAARSLRGAGLSGAALAGAGAAGALVSLRAAYPRPPRAAPPEGWPPPGPVPQGRLAVAVVLGASGSVITDALGPYEVFADATAPRVDRLIVPGVPSLDQVGPRLAGWAAERGLDIELAQADGEFSFDAMLRDLAAHADRATAHVTAKFIEYPTGHLRLAGPAWPWRPATLLALTGAAAIGAGFLPAAAAHRNRP